MVAEKEIKIEKGYLKEVNFDQFGIRLLSSMSENPDGYEAISFELSEKWASLYGLLRGLAELYKSPAAFLTNNHSHKNFTFYYKSTAKKEITAFLKYIYETLNKEMLFRKALGKLLKTKIRQDKENKMLFKSLG
ncbi:hypothetical protein [Cyclobacterium plantarum]|uniref:Uncharacterized protein n=1 Tax=Cyclobacterium plantarum TaxID=2716263 RepID=A0ABX0HF88_9BACT|nr:hypothetical protein [Cyclobacterium plantarum]NHE59633.1 hypothetical protein [Cyclobacterium plantarum]